MATMPRLIHVLARIPSDVVKDGLQLFMSAMLAFSPAAVGAVEEAVDLGPEAQADVPAVRRIHRARDEEDVLARREAATRLQHEGAHAPKVGA